MKRISWTLAGLLLVQVILLLLVYSPWSGGPSAGGARKLLPALASFTPTRIEVVEGDESIHLERSDGAWTLEERDGFPADGTKVDTLLDNLEDLTVRNPVVSSGRYHAALKVADDDFERRLRIWGDASGDAEIDLIVGSSPNYRRSHVRLASDDRVYEVRGINAYDLRSAADAWIERQLLDIPFDDVVRMKLTNAHGTFQVERQNGAWKLTEPASGGQLDDSKVDSAVRSFCNLWMSEPSGRLDASAQGFDPPAATVEIAYAVGAPSEDTDAEVSDEAGEDEAGGAESSPPETVVTTLRIGKEIDEDDRSRYAAVSGSEFAVVLSKFDAEKATEKKLADLYAEAD